MGYQGRSLSVNEYDNSDVIILDDISASFNGSTSSFTLTQNGANFRSISAVSTFVKLGGIIQTPNEDYTISYSSGVSTINFTTVPVSGLTCEIRTLLGTTVGNVGPDQVKRTNLDLSQTSDPTVDLGAGDLYYNSTNEILKTYNLTNTSWDTVYDRDVLFLDSTNNRVGIGTTNPDTVIHIKNDNSSLSLREIKIDASGAPNDSYSVVRLLGDGGSSGKYIIGYNSAVVGQEHHLALKNEDGPITFFTDSLTSNTEKLHITTNGRIGINSLGAPTDIPSTTHDTVVVGNSSATGGGVTVEVASGNNGGFQIYAQGSQPAVRMLYIGSNNSLDFYVQNSAATGENTILRLRDDKDVQIIDGNLRVASGRGIDFSATSDGSGTSTSELFDDYEEGTWTPLLSSGSGCFSGITSFNATEGKYIKIGAQVTAWFSVSPLGTITNAEGVLRMDGLPYTPNFNSFNYGAGSAQLYSSHATNDSEVLSAGIGTSGSSLLYLYRGTVNGTTGGSIMGFVIYRTA